MLKNAFFSFKELFLKIIVYDKKQQRLRSGLLPDFLLQIPEYIRVEKFFQRDAQPIAKFLDGRDGGAVVSSVDDVVNGGLGYSAHRAKLVDGNLPLSAKL